MRIEVFFAPAKLGQKMDFKSPLRGQIKVFRQAEPDFEMKSGFVFFVTKRNYILKLSEKSAIIKKVYFQNPSAEELPRAVIAGR